MTEPEHLTIDDLAQRAGIPTSTVRMYQAKALLPPPVRRGRSGYYGPGHLARLRLIGQLQERGFSLASIKPLVEAWEHGRDIEDVLGLESQVATMWSAEEPLRLNPAQFAARFEGQMVIPETVQRAIALGLIAMEGAEIVVKNPRFLDVGSELARMGIPVSEILDELVELRRTTDGVALRFTGVFERHLWGPFLEKGMPPDELRQLTESLQRLSSLAERVVVVALRDALRRAAGELVADQASALGGGMLDGLRPLVEAAGLDL